VTALQTAAGWAPADIALRAYQDLCDGQYVNLGIGLPTLLLEAAATAADGKEVIFHSEHGVLGLAAAPVGAPVDPDLIDAGKNPAALAVGGCFFSHAEAFAMIRGGHIDVSVLGAFEVSCAGDVANWSTDPGQDLRTRAPRSVPAVGGAVDLAAGARSVVVLMKQATRGGQLRLVGQCSLPLTGRRCVSRVYTDLGVFTPTGHSFRLEEPAPGITADYLTDLFESQDVALEWQAGGAAA
jgi:3-oxoacid CoA-transferase B subunit